VPADAELNTALTELASVEAEIAKFKSENMGRLPEQFQANVAQLQLMQAQLVAANEAMSRFQREKLVLETQLQNELAQRRYYESQPIGDGPKLKQLQQRIEDVRSQIEHSGDTYTENHPVLKSLRAQLVALERERDAEALGEPSRKMILDLDGSIAMIKTQIQSVNLSMDEKWKQVVELNRTMAHYQQRIENSPKLEALSGELLHRLALAREQVERFSNRPSGPRLISRRDPEYTTEARTGHLEGKVELAITVDINGRPTEIQVTRGLGAGLDEKAVECVKNWRFRPALRSGQPVTAFASVEVVFRLP
jgi:TonB family protein